MKRRRFLLGAGSVATMLLTAPSVARGMKDSPENEAVKRIANRIEAFKTDFHPEDVLVFFRNIKMAHSMLLAADSMKNLDHKPKIAFNVGAGHAGIEDFLIAGIDNCRTYMLRYPQFFLDDLAKANQKGDLYSVRRVTLPKDYKAGDLNNPNLNIKDEILIDTKLKDVLGKKIGHEI